MKAQVHTESSTGASRVGSTKQCWRPCNAGWTKHLDAMTLRRRTIEHVFGTLKHWMGSAHFLTRRLANVTTEMSLHVLAYNLKRVISILGIARTMKAMRLAGA